MNLVPCPSFATIVTFISSRTILILPKHKVASTALFAVHITCRINIRLIFYTSVTLNNAGNDNDNEDKNNYDYNPHML